MSSKIFSLMTAFVLSVFLLVSVSAAIIEVSDVNYPSNVSHNDGSFQITFDLTNTEVEATDLNWSSIRSQDATISFSQDTLGAGTIEEPNTESITATVSFEPHKNGNIEIEISGNADGNGGEFDLGLIDVEILPLSSLSITSETMAQDTNTSEFTIKNEGNVDLTNIELTVTDGFVVELNPATSFPLDAGDSQVVTITRTTDLDDLDLGTNEITITATAEESTTASGTLTIEKVYCEEGEITSNIKLVSNVR